LATGRRCQASSVLGVTMRWMRSCGEVGESGRTGSLGPAIGVEVC
jgi:hypothetical protein